MEKTLLDRERQLIQIGIALSSEKNLGYLMEMILEAAKDLTNADGGTLYTVTEKKKLHLEIVRTDSLGYCYGGVKGKKASFPDIDFIGNERAIVAYAANHKKTINIIDAYMEEGYDFSLAKKFDEINGYRTKSVLAIPMVNHDAEVIGVLQLINAKGKDSFSQEDQQLAESLASQAGVVVENLQLITGMRDLFEAFIRTLDEAIDDMSAATGNHEEHVPILTMMLAEAANESGYCSLTEDELYELKIASLLHDCGKITTPTYILDKVNKLETLFDQIHLIDVRLELRRKEAEIDHLKGKIDAKVWREELERINKIETFLHRCNKSPLTELDQVELISMKKEGFITQEEWEHLSIVTGNLTKREREIVQHHVVVTMKMLSQLPYPKNLKRVPSIAAAHHERLDGKGYPKGLKGDQISTQARILAIADVFEALSAHDRSYKMRFPLSKVINIMTGMAQNGHLDPKLFEIFLQKKVYLTYASHYLAEDQIDVE